MNTTYSTVEPQTWADQLGVVRSSSWAPSVSNIWAIHPSYHDEIRRFLDNPSFHFVQAAPPKRAPESGPGYSITNGVAVIPVQGMMLPRRTWATELFGISTMPEMEERIDAAAHDKAVNAIMLDGDSPGGTADRTPQFADAIHSAKKRKPVVAHIQNVGASAAYYALSQADKVYASRGAVVGSIGTYAVLPDFSEAAAREGVKMHVIKAGAMKGTGVPGTKVTQAQLDDEQRVVDQINENFVKGVARGRRITLAQARSLADGRVHVDGAAQELGLIDGIRSRQEVFSELQQIALGKKENHMLAWK